MEGSLSSIEGLFNQYYSVLCNYANNIIRDRDSAEDIVQDVFLNVWLKRAELDFNSPLKPYLYKSTSNAAINWLEKSKRTTSIEQIPEEQQDRYTTPENTVEAKELLIKINAAINRLPPKCKAIFVLSRTEGMKYKDIALHLDISVKTVENQMSIALERLRNELKLYLTREFITLLGLLAAWLTYSIS